jgi:hypothetical protein
MTPSDAVQGCQINGYEAGKCLFFTITVKYALCSLTYIRIADKMHYQIWWDSL